MLSYNNLTHQQYENLVVEIISSAEAHEPKVYWPSNDNVTIGYGYTFTRNNNVTLWQNAGITLTAAELTLLQAIDSATTDAAKNQLANTFTRSINWTEARNLLLQTYPEYEQPANSWGMNISIEKAVIVSMTYNRGEPAMRGETSLQRAIQTKNRAEAWFEIRYMAWGSNTNYEAGLRKRRLLESQIFGLYDRANATTQNESEQIYKMFSLHRETILNLEALWGVNPDGSAGVRNLIYEANRDFNGPNIPTVETILQVLNTAKNQMRYKQKLCLER